MARGTRSTAAQQQQPRKRKRTSSAGPHSATKLQKTDDGNDDTEGAAFLSEADAQKILDILEL